MSLNYGQPGGGRLVGGPRNPGGVLQNPRDIIQPDTDYFIKSKGSQKVLDVIGESDQPEAFVRQLTLNGNFGQKFIFTDAGGSFFFFRSTSGFFITLLSEPVISQPGKPPVSNQFLTQERLAKNTPISNTLDARQWNVLESGKPACFLIVNKTNETRALQPSHHVAALGAALLLQSQTSPRGTAPATAQIVIAPKQLCSKEKKDEVLAPATASTPEVCIDCSLTLNPEDIIKMERRPITKRLIIEGANASGVTVDCGGATIYGDSDTVDMVEIRSSSYQDPATRKRRWVRPQNITLRNCKIRGSVRIWGMGQNGQAEDIKISSRLPGHVARVRDNAPYGIVFDNVTITGLGERIPLYLAPGVSYFQMLNSEIKGSTGSVNIYLDTESCHNTFRNNHIHASTSKREVMAIDGSSHNIIVNNFFSALNNGGIYLYRNCGEGGTIRHSTPSNNTIVNNVFYYNKYDGDNPSIFVASRNGQRNYCDHDHGYPYGSSVSNYDYAKFNVVMQNQIYKPQSVSKMIRVGQPLAGIIPGTREPVFLNINTPNYLDHNEVVSAEIPRRAGCYISDSFPNFIPDGQFVNLFHNPNGEPACRGYRLTCRDGVLTRSNDPTCQASQVRYVDFECQATSNSNGCQKMAIVPAGKQIVGAKAACNLELGMVSATDLNKIPVNLVQVLRASDKVLEGKCTLGSASIHNGQAAVNGLNGLNHISFGCRERDKNGGDCHIKGRLYYR